MPTDNVTLFVPNFERNNAWCPSILGHIVVQGERKAPLIQSFTK